MARAFEMKLGVRPGVFPGQDSRFVFHVLQKLCNVLKAQNAMQSSADGVNTIGSSAVEFGSCLSWDQIHKLGRCKDAFPDAAQVELRLCQCPFKCGVFLISGCIYLDTI